MVDPPPVIEPPVEPEPVNPTPTLNGVSFSSLFTATPQADRIKLETVLASLNAQTLSEVEYMVNILNSDQKNTFKTNANTLLASTAQPANATEIEALGNGLAQLIIVAGLPPVTPPVEPPPVDPPPTTEPPHQHENLPVIDESKIMKPEVGYATLRIRDTNQKTGPSTTDGDFRIQCEASHMGTFDPIVYPGQARAGHLHLFFGNVTTNPYSTTDSLKNAGNSTCFGGIGNRSGYWVPPLIDTRTNTPIYDSWALFYYKGGKVKPPNGLVILAGDMKATKDNPQSLNVIDWQCNPHIDGQASYHARKNHIVPCSGDLVGTVKFPNCWDGKRLDSPDHKSHMAYHNGVSCPATHPYEIPNITYAIHNDVNGTDYLRLSSDNYIGGAGGYSFHGDYMFAWDDDVLDQWWVGCNGADRDCGANLLGNGKELY